MNLKTVLNNGRIVCRSALWSMEDTLKVWFQNRRAKWRKAERLKEEQRKREEQERDEQPSTQNKEVVVDDNSLCSSPGGAGGGSGAGEDEQRPQSPPSDLQQNSPKSPGTTVSSTATSPAAPTSITPASPHHFPLFSPFSSDGNSFQTDTSNCPICSIPEREDLQHFLLKCMRLQSYRDKYLNKYISSISDVDVQVQVLLDVADIDKLNNPFYFVTRQSKNEFDKLSGYYNTKYNEENLQIGTYHFPKDLTINDFSATGPTVFEYFYNNAYTKNDISQTSFSIPKTVEMGYSSTNVYKRRTITPRTRIRIKWNPKANTIDAPDILVLNDSASFGAFCRKLNVNKAPPLLYIRPYSGEKKDVNAKDGTQMIVSYITCRVRAYYRFMYSGRLYNVLIFEKASEYTPAPALYLASRAEPSV
uniref:Homeobox domain-containing protein n=1 Tax=Rhodnius prolixus TaxID=13249 RepID=T1HRX9_RHOPR